jgi:hypothetical protein
MSETIVCFLLKFEEGAASGEAYTDSGDLARLIGRASTPLAGVVANIPPVFFDALIHVAATSALTTSGVTRLVDPMVEIGLVVRENPRATGEASRSS